MLASMNAGELSSFLIESGLIPVGIDMQKFLELCPLSEKAQEELAIMLPEAPTTFGIDAITDAYNCFYAKRAATKRELETVKKKSSFEGNPPVESMEAIDKAIAKITARQQERTDQNRRLVAYNQALKKRTEAIDSIHQIEIQIKECDVQKPDPAQRKELEKRIHDTETEVSKKKGTLNVILSNIQMFDKSLQNLDTTICPLSEKLICTTDKTAAKQEIMDLLAQNSKERDSLAQEIHTAEESLTALREQIEAYDKQVDKYRSLQMLHDKYKFMKANIPELPEKPEILPSSDENEKQISSLREKRNIWIEFNLAMKAQKDCETIQKQLDGYEELVKALSPKHGILEKIIAFAFEPLLQHCNDRAKVLKKDFELAVHVDKGVHILCKTSKDSGFIDIKNISSGEQLLAIFIIADMLNALSGFKILILDDLDKLDRESLDSLLSLIMDDNILADYDHIFLATVDHPDAVQVFEKYSDQIQTVCM